MLFRASTFKSFVWLRLSFLTSLFNFSYLHQLCIVFHCLRSIFYLSNSVYHISSILSRQAFYIPKTMSIHKLKKNIFIITSGKLWTFLYFFYFNFSSLFAFFFHYISFNQPCCFISVYLTDKFFLAFYLFRWIPYLW